MNTMVMDTKGTGLGSFVCKLGFAEAYIKTVQPHCKRYSKLLDSFSDRNVLFL